MPNRRHGWGGTPTYKAWRNMIYRCTNERCSIWKDYGGRGIKVCPRWMEFENFLADMGRRPKPWLSLERINNDGDYEPANCKWATRSEQMSNTRPRKGGWKWPDWRKKELRRLRDLHRKNAKT